MQPNFETSSSRLWTARITCTMIGCWPRAMGHSDLRPNDGMGCNQLVVAFMGSEFPRYPGDSGASESHRYKNQNSQRR